MSVVDAILMESESLTVTRHAPGTRTLGIVTPGASSTFEAHLSIQPLRAREARQLPEGSRQRGSVVCYGVEELIATEPPNVQGDTFGWKGRTYEVVDVEDWTSQGGYYRSIAAKVE